MANRVVLVARSIVWAILNVDENGKPKRKPSFLSSILKLFRIYWLTFELVRSDIFKTLRSFWMIDYEDYKASFSSKGSDQRGRKGHKLDTLIPLGDMGYSGSTFFRTSDSAYLVKSVPRSFEHNFFKNEMLVPYAEHMRAEPASLLVRITDFLQSTHASLGLLFGLAPSHHIIMENILYGQDENTYRDEEDTSSSKPKWESWDLKPASYFYPERDIAGGALATEATLSKLADEFDGKLLLSVDVAQEFKMQLEKDTKLLADCNAVDYSLFLVRIPSDDAPDVDSRPPLTPGEGANKPVPPSEPPFAPPTSPSWRTGVRSSNGKEIYRAAILDFFWAKHTIQAKAMTGLINSYNAIDRKGPMSVTTTSPEYRERFLKMCMDMIETPSVEETLIDMETE